MNKIPFPRALFRYLKMRMTAYVVLQDYAYIDSPHLMYKQDLALYELSTSVCPQVSSIFLYRHVFDWVQHKILDLLLLVYKQVDILTFQSPVKDLRHTFSEIEKFLYLIEKLQSQESMIRSTRILSI